ncbi:MAG: rhodanese-like domain-containing protein [Candidatus Dormibacter sp.]
MPKPIFEVSELKTQLARGAQLVDVMPAEDFAEDHLPGAINIPLRDLNAGTAATLRRDRPVIAYCDDFA